MKPMCDICDRERDEEGPCGREVDPEVGIEGRICDGTVSWQATAEKYAARLRSSQFYFVRLARAAVPLLNQRELILGIIEQYEEEN